MALELFPVRRLSDSTLAHPAFQSLLGPQMKEKQWENRGFLPSPPLFTFSFYLHHISISLYGDEGGRE